MPRVLHISRVAARGFVRRALGLDGAFSSVPAALEHLGYVQIDPINVCGRMHDLILRNRVAGYLEGDLLRHIYERVEASGATVQRSASVEPGTNEGERRAFEHYLPGTGVLAAMPASAYPYLAHDMRQRRRRVGRYLGKLDAKETRLAKRVLSEIAERGPLTSDEIEHDARAVTAWGSQARMVKTVLDKLFAHGKVLIAERRNFRRVYDLPQRVLPAFVLDAREPSAKERSRFRALLRFRQRRLAFVKRGDQELLADLIAPIEIEGCPPIYYLREDEHLLTTTSTSTATSPLTSTSTATSTSTSTPTLLLAPLDPLLYDRRLTRALFDFDYTWEVYTPAHKRTRGYYALPVLSKNALIGHVDCKADRAAKKLVVVSAVTPRGHSVTAAVRELAHFLGLS